MAGKKRKATTASNNKSTTNTNKRMWNSKKKKNTSSSGGSTSNNNSSNTAAIQSMFQELAEDQTDPTNSVINMEGIANLGEKLGIDVTEDLRILVFLFKLGVKEKPGYVTYDEWMKGCNTLHIYNYDNIQEQLPSYDPGFMENYEFKDFYKFCFKFNLSGTHRTLDKEVVIALLQMVLKERIEQTRLDSFIDFLQLDTNKNYTRITLDQWTSFFDFCQEVGTDLSEYDESTSAWPVVIDEYVEYIEQKQKQK